MDAVPVVTGLGGQLDAALQQWPSTSWITERDCEPEGAQCSALGPCVTAGLTNFQRCSGPGRDVLMTTPNSEVPAAGQCSSAQYGWLLAGGIKNAGVGGLTFLVSAARPEQGQRVHQP